MLVAHLALCDIGVCALHRGGASVFHEDVATKFLYSGSNGDASSPMEPRTVDNLQYLANESVLLWTW